MKGWKHILLAFRFFMVLVYVALGVVILFTDLLPIPVNTSGKTFIGILLLLYGSYRAYTYIKAYKEVGDEE